VPAQREVSVQCEWQKIERADFRFSRRDAPKCTGWGGRVCTEVLWRVLANHFRHDRATAVGLRCQAGTRRPLPLIRVHSFIDVSTTLDRTTIDRHSYPHGPSESKIERRNKTEAPRAFAPASRSGKHPAYRQLCAPFFFTGVRSTWHHLAAIQRPAHPARSRPGGGFRHWTSQRG
jgi:hypothetical protein